jgi:hypothetical protein
MGARRSHGSAWQVRPPRAPGPAAQHAAARSAYFMHRSPALRMPASAAWSAFGAGAGQDRSSGAGIMEANEQLILTPFPCHRHPASGHPLRDLPADCGLPARHPQRGADRALPPRPSRSARPSRPVRSAARPSTPPVASPAAIAPNPERPRTQSVAAFAESPRAYCRSVVSRTLVFDDPRRVRTVFEQLLAGNINLGRPEHIEVIFGFRVARKTPGDLLHPAAEPRRPGHDQPVLPALEDQDLPEGRPRPSRRGRDQRPG